MTIAEQVKTVGITSTDPMWELVSVYLGIPMAISKGSGSIIPPTNPPPPYGWFSA